MRKATRFQHVFTAAFLGSLGCCGMFFLAGCGGSGPPPASTDGATPQADQAGEATASRSGDNDAAAKGDGGTDADPPLPKEGSPEWLLGKMIVLRAEPLPTTKSPQEVEAALRARNEKLVEMAGEIIGKTHKDKSKESVFNGAVHFLVESRLQMAIAGGKAETQSLYDDARDLYQRDPASEAAAEAGFAVVRLANTNARRFAKSDPHSLQDFAVQAKLFATRFPTNDSRAVQLLYAAGQSCELYHMEPDAVSCYAMLQEKYPQSPQAQRAVAALRRLQLKGKRLELGGETPAGGFVKVEQFRGKPVLVAFWASDSQPFQRMLPRLQSSIGKHEKSGLTVVGVCLDETETSLDAFVEKTGLTWTQIFYADAAKRRWEHPAAVAYGVHEIPTLWLVDANGIVVDTHVTPESLDGQMKSLIASRMTGVPR